MKSSAKVQLFYQSVKYLNKYFDGLATFFNAAARGGVFLAKKPYFSPIRV